MLRQKIPVSSSQTTAVQSSLSFLVFMHVQMMPRCNYLPVISFIARYRSLLLFFIELYAMHVYISVLFLFYLFYTFCHFLVLVLFMLYFVW